MINGRAYDWASVKIIIMGVAIAGITAVKYEDEQEMENNYGIGKYPVSRGQGLYKASASITLHSDEVIALTKSVTSGRLQDIPPFDINVSYIGENNSIITDIIKNVQFLKNQRDVKMGDKVIPVELPLIVSHILWNA